MSATQKGLGMVGVMVASVVGAACLLGSGRSALLGTVPPAAAQRSPEPAWAHRIALVDQLLARADLSRAASAWRDAHGAALASRRWTVLAELGDRAARMAGLNGGTPDFRAEARRVYLAALFQARAEGSTQGVHRVAEAFERLGDLEVAERARLLAEPPSPRSDETL
jgi:hypothetical protein